MLILLNTKWKNIKKKLKEGAAHTTTTMKK
jgi:hypothetical protein